MSIMTIIILVVVNIFVGTIHFNRDEQSRIDVGDAASRTFSTLDESLRQGKSILTSSAINGTTYTTGDQTVVLTWPSLVAGSPSASVTDTVVITYNAAQQRLVQYISPDATSSRGPSTAILTTNVTDLYFRYTSDNPTASTTVAATIVTGATVNGQPFKQTAILNATLRNHS